MSNITPEDIVNMSYTDFVGEINQWNTLPGAYSTLSEWINYGRINEDSHYLDIACTTGIKSRTISELTGCRAIGIDISKNSVDSAVRNSILYSSNSNIQYFQQDGTSYFPEEKFTHISFGASLRFFKEPEKMIDHLTKNLIKDGGYILISEFYTDQRIPDSLYNDFYKIFDIYPTNNSYKEVMSLYKGFEIIHEDRKDIFPETQDEIIYYCDSTVKKYFIENKLDFDKDLYDALYSRLFSIKEMSNRLRPYQRYNVAVLRYRKSIYPNRYVELF